jgi:hypothetical protein
MKNNLKKLVIQLRAIPQWAVFIEIILLSIFFYWQLFNILVFGAPLIIAGSVLVGVFLFFFNKSNFKIYVRDFILFNLFILLPIVAFVSYGIDQYKAKYDLVTIEVQKESQKRRDLMKEYQLAHPNNECQQVKENSKENFLTAEVQYRSCIMRLLKEANKIGEDK